MKAFNFLLCAHKIIIKQHRWAQPGKADHGIVPEHGSPIINRQFEDIK